MAKLFSEKLTMLENEINELKSSLSIEARDKQLEETNKKLSELETKITQIVNELTPIITSHANALKALLSK